MCGDVDTLEFLEGAHAYGGCAVDVEHEEGRRYGDDGLSGICGHAVGDGAHGVLSDSPVDVSSCVVTIDAAFCLEIGLEENRLFQCC